MQALVIDDARIMRLLLRSVMEKLGFQVFEAGNGREGLDHLESFDQPDVILVDWHMPEMNGVEFVRRIRASQRHAEIPVILVTAEENQAEVRRAVAAGANATLSKPFTVDLVRARLALVGVAACAS
jgi:two-component system, chemotaxis family, chemotaxis protein CheY